MLMRVYGWTFVTYGTVVVWVLANVRIHPAAPWLWYILGGFGLGFSLGPGLAYLLLANYLKQGKSWAPIVAVSVVVAHASLAGTVAIAAAMRDFVVFPIINGVLTLALVAIAPGLLRAYMAGRSQSQQGFAPIVAPMDVLPVEEEVK